MTGRHQWFGPMAHPPAAELLDELERDGLELVQILPSPRLLEGGQVVLEYRVLMRRREAPRVVLPH